MTQNEKAIANLAEKGIQAIEENRTVYVCINDVQLELAIYEIEYQEKEYELWYNKNTNEQYKVPIEIVRDFKNAEIVKLDQ